MAGAAMTAEAMRPIRESNERFPLLQQQLSLLDYSERLLTLAEELTERLAARGSRRRSRREVTPARSGRARPSRARSSFPD